VSQASTVPSLPRSGDAPRLAHVVDVDAHEGPVYAADEHALYFTSLPRPGQAAPVVDIKRLDLASGGVTVLASDARMANGMVLDHDGALLVCEQGTFALPAAIARVDRLTGERATIVAAPLNSPNDVVVKSDGTIWFTDPSYGWLQGFRPEPAGSDAVYRYDPRTGELAQVADSFDKPNGLCFSPGETTLYVGDNGGPHHVKAFDVIGGRSLARERVLAEIGPGHPDGMKVDAQGRLYVSSPIGVQVLNPAGVPVEEIALPGAVNFCFGGPERDVLFITTDTAIHAAYLQAKGS
jgi:gluconolactonase